MQVVKMESEKVWGLHQYLFLPFPRDWLPQVPNPEEGRLLEMWALLA